MLHMLFWICNGYPWNKGVEPEELIGLADVILPAKTWEHEIQMLHRMVNYFLGMDLKARKRKWRAPMHSQI
eukprot:c26281_g1_i1 orf=162-374(-)